MKNKKKKLRIEDVEQTLAPDEGEPIEPDASAEPAECEGSAAVADEGDATGPEEVEDIEVLLAKMTENWQRERANFINFKRRVEEEKREIRKYASYDLAFDLLRVLDYFESSISFSENLPEEARSVILGVKYTISEMSQVLAAHGICPIEVESGDLYDSHLMEAVESRELCDVEAGTILEVRQRGWMFHDRVLRAARVIVAVARGDDNNKGGDEPEVDLA